MKEKRSGRFLSPFRIAGIYAVLGGLWILFSDTLLAEFVIDSATIVRLSIYKGWAFVLVTALLLYWLVRRYVGEQQALFLAMNKSKQYNRALFEQTLIGLALCRMDGTFVDVNEAYARGIGRTVEETLQLTYWDITPQKYAEQEQAQLESLGKTGKYGPYEKEQLHKDGRLVPVRLQGRIIEQSGERFIWSSVEDITERKRTEETILQQSNNLVALLEISQTITATLDMETVLQTIVESATRLAGLDTGAIYLIKGDALYLGATTPPLPPQFPDVFRRTPLADHPHIVKCVSSGLPVILPDMATADLTPAEQTICETRNLRSVLYMPLMIEKLAKGVLIVGTQKESHEYSETELNLYRTLSNQAALAVENAYLFEETAKHASNLEQRVIERTVDLEKKSADLQDNQRALMNIVEDLNLQTIELETANDKLKELDRLKSMFIASMSHELRTPLNSIIGFTGIILQGMAGDINNEQRDQLKRVSRAGKHVLALITDVIDIAKIESGRIQPYAEEFQLIDVVDEACESMRAQLQEKGLALQKIVPDEPVLMNTDRRRFLQCLLNFMSNAIKFTEKGSITVSVDKMNGSVKVTVSDTGIGIKPEYMQLLFQSFVRLDSPLKTTTPGTGLGLYLTKKLAVEVLGGTVYAQSVEDRGSAFSIVIPKELITGKERLR